jgi:hypothetical protein
MLDQHYLMVVNHRQDDELEQRLITAEMYFMWKTASTPFRPQEKRRNYESTVNSISRMVICLQIPTIFGIGGRNTTPSY